MKSVSLSIPLKVNQCKTKIKWFHLNLNNFINICSRSPHQRNAIKQKYQKLIEPQILALERVSVPVTIHYTIYLPTKRRCDLMNVASIVDKFFSDALVECEYLHDDSVKEITAISCEFGGYSKDNPRADVVITESKASNQ